MRIAVWVLLGIEAFYAVGALVGAVKGEGGDAAGKGLVQAYAVIGLVLAVLLLVPALLRLLNGHALIPLVLCVLFLLPALVALVA